MSSDGAKTAETGRAAAPALRQPAAQSAGMVQLKTELANMTYEQQTAAVRPSLPLQYNTPSSGIISQVGGDSNVAVQMSPPAPTPATPPINAATREADVKSFCAPDRIAMQKLDDVDNERYMQDVDAATAKGGFYQSVGDYINGNHASLVPSAVFNACFNRAAGPYKFKGTKIDQTLLTGVSSRTGSVGGFWRFQVNQDHFKTEAAAELGVPVSAPEVTDLARAKWVAACKGGGELKGFLDTGKQIAPVGYPAWFTPDKVEVSTDPTSGYADLMTIFALQPEWFPEGNVLFDIDPAGINGELRKPTAYDGMQSSLWVARNQPAQTFGLTGGQAREYIANDVPVSAVVKASGVVPSDDFLAQVVRLSQRAKDIWLRQNPDKAAELQQLRDDINRLPDGSDKDTAKDKLRELDSWTPNLTDWVMRGQTTDLTSHIGVKIRDAKAVLERVRQSTQNETSSPAPARAGTPGRGTVSGSGSSRT